MLIIVPKPARRLHASRATVRNDGGWEFWGIFNCGRGNPGDEVNLWFDRLPAGDHRRVGFRVSLADLKTLVAEIEADRTRNCR